MKQMATKKKSVESLDGFMEETFDKKFIKESSEQYDMISWMANWCKREGLTLELEGEVGFFRPCVGVVGDFNFPDYMWYDDNFERVDRNGDVWTPERAYHKNPCVAVLGTDDESVKQLYEWLKWFDENNFHYAKKTEPFRDGIELILFGRFTHRMVRGV